MTIQCLGALSAVSSRLVWAGLLHETLQGKTGQGIVVGVNRLIDNGRGFGLPSLSVEPPLHQGRQWGNLAEMSDAPVRRTALEVTDFLVNRLTGPEMPHAWE